MGNSSSKKKKSQDNENINNQNIKKEEKKKETKPNKPTKTQKDEENISKYIKEKIETNPNNYYQVKNIENEYKKLENEIHQLCLDKNGDDDDEDGSKFEKFLENLKNISEKAEEISKELEKALYKEFQKNNPTLKSFKEDNKVDEGCINEFSSWCKNNLQNEEKFVEDFCKKKDKEKKYSKEEDFDLLKKLTKIYLECEIYNEICNEHIEYRKCDKECNFDNKEMFDLAEVRGAKKKVKFCVLPGLFYNGEFFQNGKIHVLAYSIKNK